MPIAIKEWAVTIRALAEGEQLLIFRSGAEEEPEALENSRFFLFPTFEHEANDVVRGAHVPELRRALEEGVWPDGDPPVSALTRPGGIEQPDRVRVRAWAEVAGEYTITDQRIINELSPFYIWTNDYAAKRLGWRRRSPLRVTLLRTHRIPRPVTIRVRPEHDFGPTWLEITRELPFEGTPVLSDLEFGRVQEEIESIVSGRIPALA
ncbi:MAG: DUF1802 family protein [Actinobacteria bacterium]|uniref:Unannotated protein n=1 Tax=freshwater metagenome TaxID=449393 RepID=A0A6J5ZQL4_9ZZZZ|nr:DUF1802 family protein [Actinomycetota bacterium]